MKCSQKVEVNLTSVVTANNLNQTRHIAVKTGVTGIKRGQVVIIKTTGVEPWDGTAAGKLAIATQAQLESHTAIPCLVTGGYMASQVLVGDVPVNTAQKLALMSSILFEGQ
ncbi:hypothetical protein K6327_000916 [Vibrio vulnificus]|nr:hypothetical protein [Vibrio vulnificus]